jgi:DNA uptake protein ComE-like DNA-binding protein
MGIREFFYLHKSDRQVFLVLLLAVGVLIGVEMVLEWQTTDTDKTLAQPTDSAKAQPAALKNTPHIFVDSVPVRRVERFVFDPNTADSSALLRLGLQPWQVRNIYKYRAAGGIFRTKEDFARVYGLTQKEYRELEPYIRISADYLPAALLVKEKTPPRDTLLFPQKLKEGETIDLSSTVEAGGLSLADTARLKRVPGIGSYYARQIVSYGRRLGGYVSVDQLDEIEHFPAEAKKYFVIGTASPRQLNVNRLSLGELKQHPYLSYYQARAIEDYRRKYGPLKSLDDLRLLPDFTDEQLQRLAPYVSF